MASLRWSAQALAELDLIERYLSQASASHARSFVEGALAAVRRLETFPRSGRKVPEVQDDALREVLYRGYRLVYHVDDEGEAVEILTVFHASRAFGDAAPS
jgi:toxin ParE1/3/4